MIALVRRLFLKLRLLVVPGATRLARAGVGGAGARGAGGAGIARELPPPRHQTMGGDPVGVVVSAVGGCYDERDYRVIPCRAAARAELRGVRAARVGPPSGTVRSFTASRHFLEMCEFHPTEAAGGRGARAAPEVRARRRLFVRCWWWVARAPCVLSRSWRRRVSCTKTASSCATATTSHSLASPKGRAVEIHGVEPRRTEAHCSRRQAWRSRRERNACRRAPRPPPPALVGAGGAAQSGAS